MHRLHPGARIGDFVVEAEIARGGMGAIFRARQRSLGDRLVALKVLPTGATSPEEERRFLAEAQAASSLHHPHLVEVYVKANQRAEQDPAFDDRAREFFRRMEADDPDALALWREFRDVSVRELERIYARLGIRFEHYEGESRYQGKMEPVIEEIARTVGVKTSEGALIVDLPYGEGEPPVLLKKGDGSTLYVTRDLAAAIDRHARFAFDRRWSAADATGARPWTDDYVNLPGALWRRLRQ